MSEHSLRPSLEQRFVFGHEVGRGAFGQVLVGEDRVTGERVAIKRIVERGEDPAEVERFLLESRLIERVDNPHVVRYIADGVDNQGCPCLVLEWLEGQSLAVRQRLSPVSVADACEIARQVTVGLDALHNLGIVHRDIKPSNLFVRELADGQLHVTVLDLGAARARGDATLTVAGMLVGTPAYMAPEQARGDSALTLHADLFSLSTVLFELLAHRRAFEGPPHAVLAQILLGELPDISQLVPTLHPNLVAIVRTAMARTPSERFVSAAEMGQALQEALDHGLSTETPHNETDIAGLSRAIDSGASASRSDVATDTFAPPSSSSGPLGAAERRLVCVLFASFENADDPGPLVTRFCTEATARNAETFSMLDARCAAVFGLRWSSSDAVLSAARTGLLLRKTLGNGAFALVTCRVLAKADAIPVDAIERAIDLLGWPAQGLMVDDVTATLLSAHFLVEDDGGYKVVRGEQLARREGPPKLLGFSTSTVGREREIAILDSTLEECLEGPESKVVLVTAPAGRGKSRLRWEWTERVRPQMETTGSPQIVVTLADPNGAGVALGLLGQLLRRAAGINDSDSQGIRREKLRARISQTVSPTDCPRVTAFLGELAGTHFAAESLAQLQAARADRMLMADQIRRAWDDWLSAETAKHGLLFVIEDVHWADAPSLAVLDSALSVLNDSPLMIVGFARPEVHETFHALFEARSVLEIRLGELRKKDAEWLIRAVLPDIEDTLLKRVVERAAGNPFVLEELIRAASVGETTTLPQAVLAVADARLQILPPESRRLLRLASVLGVEFWPGALAVLLGEQDPRQLLGWLSALESAEMITRRADSRYVGEIQYGFRHALLRDAAYAMLTEEDRVTAHYVAGEWLAQSGEADPLRVAEHFERGLRADRAAGFFAQAATDAMEHSDLAAVLTYAERALACEVDDASAGELWLLRAEAHRWRAENHEALTAGTEALQRLPPGCDAWFRAVREVLQAAGRLGDKTRLSSTAKMLLTINSRRISGAEAMACARAIVQLTHQGYTDLAQQLSTRLMRAEASGETSWDARVRGNILIANGILAHLQGELGQLAANMSQAATLLEEVGDLREASMQRVNVGYAYSQLGALAESESELRAALAVAVRLGLSDVQGIARSNLALVLGQLGRPQEAEEEGMVALKGLRAQGNRKMISVTLLYIANARLAAQDALGAQSFAEQAYEGAPNPSIRASALGVLSRIRVVLGQPTQALEDARQAIGILEIVHTIEEFELVIWLGFVESLFACGLFAEGEDALRTARDLVHSRLISLGGDELVRKQAADGVREFRLVLLLAEKYLRDTESS